jgi:hypothetical protein
MRHRLASRVAFEFKLAQNPVRTTVPCSIDDASDGADGTRTPGGAGAIGKSLILKAGFGLISLNLTPSRPVRCASSDLIPRSRSGGRRRSNSDPSDTSTGTAIPESATRAPAFKAGAGSTVTTARSEIQRSHRIRAEGSA